MKIRNAIVNVKVRWYIWNIQSGVFEWLFEKNKKNHK